MRKLIVLALFVGMLHPIYAQEFLDVLRYSNTRQAGTARSMGMGGAIGAAGVDFSVAAINPASLAQLRTSTAMFTTALNFNSTKANYLNQDVNDNRFNFSLPNMGVTISTVLYKLGKEKKEGLINHTFSFGFNRINDFNRNITLDAQNNQSSYLDDLAQDANAFLNWDDIQQDGLDPFYPEELALVGGGIVYDNTNKLFVANLPAVIDMRQLYRAQYKGRQTDWNISWAGNFSHIVYIGLGIGIPAIRYTASQEYIEEGFDNDLKVKKSFESKKEFSTSGNGINAKLGITLRPRDWIRVGVAYHTPTAYSLTDKFNYSFQSTGFSGNFVYNDGSLLKSQDGQTNSYSLTTPGKMIYSAALVYKKLGLLSFDYEVVNYANAQISGDNLSFINPLISRNLSTTDNFRVGAEYNFLDYKFRAGYGMYSSPYNNSILNSLKEGNLSLRVYSIGAGYQDPASGVYFDAAFVYERYDDFYTPYTLNDNTRPYYSSFNKNSTSRLVLSLGTKF